ncbi:MAG: tetratricopeptide repeat protein [Betaproteobacteria bacterium]|nr:tetratricopeptide repeat protein [Betaproteobacteria bacterium]
MSLLMDALKKAEEAKRLSGDAGDGEAARKGLAELALEPMAAGAAAVSGASATASATASTRTAATAFAAAPAALQPTSPLPSLAQHLDSVNADLAAASVAAPSGKRPPTASAQNAPTSGEEEKERGAARNVFAAKQPQRARALRWLPAGLAGVAILGIGVYFWWQLQAVNKGAIARPAQQAHAAAQPPLLATAPTTSRARAPEELPATVPDLVRPFAAAEPPSRQQAGRPRDAPQLPADSAIRLASRQPQTDPALERAYDALQAGQLADARRDYELALRNDPRNVDALLGLATIAARQGQSGNAADLYLRALEADPKDANAQAGLISLKGQSDPGLSESRLKTLLASQPDSFAPNFALGNLHARQNRWSEAQQAYFRAYAADPGNADALYNLAVSLDHLRQNTLAAQYYRGALNAAGTRDTAFDKNQVKSRLLDLQP